MPALSKKQTTRPSPPKRRRIQFTYVDPTAENVAVSGDFNQWSETKHRMKRDDDGVWQKIAVLKPGRYEYKFLVDGRWQEDPDNGHRCLNDFGTFNCVLHVS
jgi:1,4-alpha-glucan branching enzyme